MPSRNTFERLIGGAVLGIALSACGRDTVSDAPPSFSVRAVPFPGAEGSAQPRLTADPEGTPVLSWLEPAGDEHALRYARFESQAFTAVREVVRGGDFFVNWADLPSVQPVSREVWAAHWLRLQPDQPGPYDIATAVSTDGGRTFGAPMQLNDDDTPAEHGFVQLFPWDDGIGAFWLDGRQLAEFSFDNPDALLGTSLRVARLDRSGAVVAREIVDDLVCDCCQPDMVMLPSGPIVAYRDRTPEEIRDVVVRRYAEAQWQEPIGVGDDLWHIEGCPVNGPQIAAAGQNVAVAWFTAAGDKPRVRLAMSTDGARTFGPAVDVDGAGSFGQVGLVLEDDGTALVTWWRAAAGGGLELALRAVGGDASLGKPLVLAQSRERQPVDVPQLIPADAGLLIAWTSIDDAGTVHALFIDDRSRLRPAP
jgi:hypothetical protein